MADLDKSGGAFCCTLPTRSGVGHRTARVRPVALCRRPFLWNRPVRNRCSGAHFRRRRAGHARLEGLAGFLVSDFFCCFYGSAAGNLYRCADRPAQATRLRDRRAGSLLRRLSHRAQRGHADHRSIPASGSRRLLGAEYHVQPFRTGHALHVRDGARPVGCTTSSCWSVFCRLPLSPTLFAFSC